MTAKNNKIINETSARSLQEILFAALVMGVSVAFMLFLLGSADILTSLSIIGILLCLSLAGSTLRFLSISRASQTLENRVQDTDRSLATIQHRVNDHDLALLQMAGKIETIETRIAALDHQQQNAEERHQQFMRGMKDRMVKLAAFLMQKKTDAQKPRKQQAPKSFFAPPAKTANDIAAPAPAAAPEMTSAPAQKYEDDVYVSPALMRDAIDTAIKNGRIDAYIQPIITMPQRKTHAYELFGRVRLKPGVYIPAAQYRGVAVHAGQQIMIDRMVIAEIERLPVQILSAPLFISLCAETLCDPDASGLIVKMARRNPVLAKNLVIQLAQRDILRLDDRAQSNMSELQIFGVRFGINDVQSPDLDLNHLARIGIRYMKLTQVKLLTTKDSETGSALIHRFITRLTARGIKLIVSAVEHQDQVRLMLDYPIELAQGYVFARPDRPALFQSTNQPQIKKAS